MAKVSILDNFTNIFGNCFKAEALVHICNYITNEKKVNVTVDELIKIFDLPSGPVTPSSPLAFNTVMGIPGNAALVSTATMSAAKPSNNRGRKKNPEDANADKCRYKFTKGAPEKINETCGATSVAYKFCITCISKNDALSIMEKEGVSPEIIRKIKELKKTKPDLRTYLKDPSILNEMDNSKTVHGSNVENSNQEPTFYPIPGHEDKMTIIKELVPNAIFMRKSESDPRICCGKLENKNGVYNGPLPLTNEEAKLITSKGYTYIPPNDKNTPQAQQAPPAAVPPTQFPSMHIFPQQTMGPSIPSQVVGNKPIVPPTVLMPPYMMSSNQVAQAVSQTIMNSVPDILKMASEQANHSSGVNGSYSTNGNGFSGAPSFNL